MPPHPTFHENHFGNMRCDCSSEKNPHASINFIKKSEKFLKAYVFCCPYKKWHVGDTTFTLEAISVHETAKTAETAHRCLLRRAAAVLRKYGLVDSRQD